jgi:ssDNA-binding Zn-finger/Zn-ribbon topoisomerase 1
MRIPCPHCGQPAKIRTSRTISPLTREAYVQCENVACCHVFRVIISAVATIVPSIAPNPAVFLPHKTKDGQDSRQRSLL